MIGVDPHKASNTIVVIDASEKVLAQHRFANDRDGYQALKSAARGYRGRTWAVEGARGVGLGLAQRLVAEGEPVLDVPAKLATRIRALGGGSGRKTDKADAYAVAVAGLRAPDLKVVTADDTTTILRLLTDRRQELVEQRIASVNRLHDLLQQLIPGGVEPRLTAAKAKARLATVRPRDEVGKARKLVAAEYTADLTALDARLKDGLQSASGFYVILKSGKPIIPKAFTPTLGKRSSRNSRGRKFAQALAEALSVEADIDNPKPQVISKDDVVRKIRWQTPVWMLAGSATSLSLFTVIHFLIGT